MKKSKICKKNHKSCSAEQKVLMLQLRIGHDPSKYNAARQKALQLGLN